MNSVKPTYKSKKRDEQETRLLEQRRELIQARADILLGERPYKQQTRQTGTIFFSQRRNFVRMLTAATKFNKKELHKLYGKNFKLVSRCIDDFWIIISRYTIVVYQWVEVEPHPCKSFCFLPSTKVC